MSEILLKIFIIGFELKLMKNINIYLKFVKFVAIVIGNVRILAKFAKFFDEFEQKMGKAPEAETAKLKGLSAEAAKANKEIIARIWDFKLALKEKVIKQKMGLKRMLIQEKFKH